MFSSIAIFKEFFLGLSRLTVVVSKVESGQLRASSALSGARRLRERRIDSVFCQESPPGHRKGAMLIPVIKEALE